MVLFAFSLTRKRSTPSGRNGFALPLRSPANLIPCPYVPGIANEPSTRPITVHCETSKTLSNNHLRVPPSHVTPRSPSTSSFLTIRIPRETLRHNGVAGGRTNRPAELTTLHFYISMQNGGKKKQGRSPACEFFIFLYGSQHFYWKIFVSR